MINISVTPSLVYRGPTVYSVGGTRNLFANLHAYCSIVIIGQYTPNSHCPHRASRNLIIILFIHNPMISHQTMRFVCKAIPDQGSGHDGRDGLQCT